MKLRSAWQRAIGAAEFLFWVLLACIYMLGLHRFYELNPAIGRFMDPVLGVLMPLAVAGLLLFVGIQSFLAFRQGMRDARERNATRTDRPRSTADLDANTLDHAD